MAFAEIQRRHSTSWPAVIIALTMVLGSIAGVYWFTRPHDGIDDVVSGQAQVGPEPQAAAPAVMEFVTRIQRTPVQEAMSADHAFSSAALLQLAAALQALVDQHDITTVGPQIEVIRNRAEQLRLDSGSPDHADMVRDAFTSAASATMAIQTARYPELAPKAAALQRAAEELRVDEGLLKQHDRVERFLKLEAEILKAMSRSEVASLG